VDQQEHGAPEDHRHGLALGIGAARRAPPVTPERASARVRERTASEFRFLRWEAEPPHLLGLAGFSPPGDLAAAAWTCSISTFSSAAALWAGFSESNFSLRLGLR